MLATLLTLLPVGIVLGLLAFGDHGGPRLDPTPGSFAAVATLAAILGPVAVSAIGLFLWLLFVALGVSLLTLVAVLRLPPEAAHR